MNPKAHSFSRMNNFQEKCERQHAYDAILGKWEDTPAQARGTHVHDTFEKAARLTLPHNGTPALFADDALDAVLKDPPPGPLTKDKLTSYVERFRPIFKHLHPMMGPGNEPRVEEWFRELCGRSFRGKIDLISKWTPVFNDYGLFTGEHEEHQCVIDYKTTSNPNAMQDAYQARRSLQLQVYSLATGISRAGFLYFMPSGEPRGAFVNFTESDLALARKWIHGTMDVIDKRWEDAARHGDNATENFLEKDGQRYDLSVFALARVGHPLCCAKYCSYYDRCLGRKET